MRPQERAVSRLVGGAIVAAGFVILLLANRTLSQFPEPAPPSVTTVVKPKVSAAKVQVPGPVAAPSTTSSAVTVVNAGRPRPSIPSSPVADLIRLAFIQVGGPSLAEEAVRVAECESHLFEGARSGAHWGLFQISDRYHQARVDRLGYSWPDLLTAQPNIDVALDLYLEQGWKPWSCRP